MDAEPQHFVILVGLEVRDAERYAAYRRGMTPILAEYGGSFGYDLRVSEVLRSPGGEALNRVFTIRFPSTEVRDRFFADPRYLRVRANDFEPAVGAMVAIAEYQQTI